MNDKAAQAIDQAIQAANHIVVIQADNPDGDSLGSALGLEAILSDMGKEVSLYCGVDLSSSHFGHMPGWDRVTKELPNQFDLSIIVDNSANSLLELLARSESKKTIAARPAIVIDHHSEVTCDIPYVNTVYNVEAVATAEAIYELALRFKWPLPLDACNMLAVAIMSDSLGLVSEKTTARSIHIVAELVERGVNISLLDMARKESLKKSPEIVRYKGKLLERIEYFHNDQIAIITIPWEEIETYSHQFNPSVLVIEDMRMTIGVKVAIALKVYRGGKITGKIRCNPGFQIANDLASEFGGGGHPFASGFKLTDKRPLEEIKQDVINKAKVLLEAKGDA